MEVIPETLKTSEKKAETSENSEKEDSTPSYLFSMYGVMTRKQILSVCNHQLDKMRKYRCCVRKRQLLEASGAHEILTARAFNLMLMRAAFAEEKAKDEKVEEDDNEMGSNTNEMGMEKEVLEHNNLHVNKSNNIRNNFEQDNISDLVNSSMETVSVDSEMIVDGPQAKEEIKEELAGDEKLSAPIQNASMTKAKHQACKLRELEEESDEKALARAIVLAHCTHPLNAQYECCHIRREKLQAFEDGVEYDPTQSVYVTRRAETVKKRAKTMRRRSRLLLFTKRKSHVQKKEKIETPLDGPMVSTEDEDRDFHESEDSSDNKRVWKKKQGKEKKKGQRAKDPKKREQAKWKSEGQISQPATTKKGSHTGVDFSHVCSAFCCIFLFAYSVSFSRFCSHSFLFTLSTLTSSVRMNLPTCAIRTC